MKEIKNYKVNQLPLKTSPDSIYWVKNGIGVEGYITDLQGVPHSLSTLMGGGGIQSLVNTDGTITIVGGNNLNIKVSNSLQAIINSAVKNGDNITNLVNNAGYITSVDLPTTTSDLINNGQNNTSTYVEQSQLGTTAFSNNYEDLDNLPSFSESVIEITLGETVSNNKVLYLNSDGKWYLADRRAENKIKSELVYLEIAGTANTTTTAVLKGLISISGLITGQRYYVNTLGTITNTPNDIVGEFDRYIGTALSNSILQFNPDQNYFEIGITNTTGTGGGGGSGYLSVTGQSLIGVMDGINSIFQTPETIITDSEELFWNGVRLSKTIDYNISNSTITLNFSPGIGEILTINYLK